MKWLFFAVSTFPANRSRAGLRTNRSQIGLGKRDLFVRRSGPHGHSTESGSLGGPPPRALSASALVRLGTTCVHADFQPSQKWPTRKSSRSPPATPALYMYICIYGIYTSCHLCIYIYIYIYMCIHIYTHTHHIYCATAMTRECKCGHDWLNCENIKNACVGTIYSVFEN